jgi:hypothetical protein
VAVTFLRNAQLREKPDGRNSHLCEIVKADCADLEIPTNEFRLPETLRPPCSRTDEKMLLGISQRRKEWSYSFCFAQNKNRAAE